MLEKGKEVVFDLANAQNLFLLVVVVVLGVGICAFIVNRCGIKMPKIRRRRKNKRQLAEARKSGAGLLRTNAILKVQAKKQKKQPKESGKKSGRRVGGKRVGGRPSETARAPEPPADEESVALNQEPMVEANVRFSETYEQPAGLGSYSDVPEAGAGEFI